MTKFKLRVIEDAQHHMVSVKGPQVTWTFELLKDLSYLLKDTNFTCFFVFSCYQNKND